MLVLVGIINKFCFAKFAYIGIDHYAHLYVLPCVTNNILYFDNKVFI